MRFRLFWKIAVFLLVAQALKAAPRAALINFSSDDNFYRSTLAATDFSALLQAKVTSFDQVEWVERSQLQLAMNELNLTAGGYVSPSAAVHLGKLVKANLLINGHFISSAGQGRSLHIEVIDLDHADVLAETTVTIQGITNQPLVVSVSDVAAASEKLRDALQQTLNRDSQIKTQTVIAPLFFANTSTSRRLDYFENELQSVLATEMPRHSVRVLQFPRAQTASGEAELVLAGLVEQDPDAWQKVADVYVWGQFEEITPNVFSFDETPVKFTLNWWDGSGDVQSLTETVKVSELPHLQERLRDQILAAAKSFKKQAVSQGVRHQVARQLFSRANDIHAMPRPPGETEQGKQLWQYEVKLLTTAHFFAPESYIIHRQWLESRWAQSRRLFWQEMEQIRSYDDFGDKFGLISLVEVESDLVPRGRWFLPRKPFNVDYGLEGTWMSVQSDLCNTIDGHDSVGFPTDKPADFPTDAPRDVLQAWQAQIRDDFAQRLFSMYEKAIHAKPPIQVLNAHLYIDYGIAYALKDKELKAKFIEDLWPTYVAARDIPTARREFSEEEFDFFFAQGLFPKIRQVFADVGRPQQAETMIALFKQRVTITGNPTDATRAQAVAAEALRPRLVSVNLLPPKLSPNLRSIIFSSREANGVVALKIGSGPLWVSTSSQTNAAFWRLTPDSATPELLSPKIGKHSIITSFCEQNGKLWMTFDQGGVGCMNSTNLESVFYGDKEGVLSRQMFASALVDNKLFFGGGEPTSGKLNYVELPGLIWKSQALEGNEQIKLLQPFGHYLLVNNSILDLASGSWQPVERPSSGKNAGLLGTKPLEFNVLSAIGNSQALWLGTTHGLVLCNPDNSIAQHWDPLPGGYLVDASGSAKTVALKYRRAEKNNYVVDTNMTAPTATAPTSRLPGAVTALADDGDFLWIASTTRFDPSLSGNSTEGRWVNGYYVLTLNPGIDSGNSIKQGNWRNTYIKNERNYVLLFHKPTGKWVGYFPVTSGVTGLTVSHEKLWIGLEDTGYIQCGEHSWQDQEVFAPSPLLEVQKLPLESIAADKWVSDTISADELKSRSQEAAQIIKATN